MIPAAPATAQLTITVVGYGFTHEWHVIINSLLLQTDDRWFAQLINDGPGDEARAICERYVSAHPDRLCYAETPIRHNDYGHSLRRVGLAAATTPLWATQNADNYLMPRYVELVLAAFDQSPANLILFPCVHNYEHVNRRGDPPYTVLNVTPRRNRCDAGTIVIESDLARRVGWRSLDKNSDGDFIEDVMAVRPQPRCGIIKNVLMVHN